MEKVRTVLGKIPIRYHFATQTKRTFWWPSMNHHKAYDPKKQRHLTSLPVHSLSFSRMMNVIRQKDNKSVNTWYHGALINSTYGFSAEYITTQAWECQLSHGVGGPNPYNDTWVHSTSATIREIILTQDHQSISAFPTSRNSTCVIDLPVCDLRSHSKCLEPASLRGSEDHVSWSTALMTHAPTPEMRKAVKHHGTVEACRKVARLPI